MKEKKHLLLSMAVLAALPLYASYTAMTFETVEGESKSLDVNNLIITIYDNTLVATSGGGRFEIPFEKLAQFYFSGATDAVTSVESVDGNPVRVFTIAGAEAGTFRDVNEAKAKLPAGIYLVQSGKSVTKIKF